jgi:hypothetical protein
MQIFNEVRAIVISWFLKIVKYKEKENKMTLHPNLENAEDSSSEDDDLERIPDFFIIEDHMLNGLLMNEEQLQCFVLKRSMVSEEWKKRRTNLERKMRLKN